MAKTGRPRKNERRCIKLDTRFTAKEFEELSMFSRLERMSRSDYIRIAVKMFNAMNRTKYGLDDLEDDYEQYEYDDFDENEDENIYL